LILISSTTAEVESFSSQTCAYPTCYGGRGDGIVQKDKCEQCDLGTRNGAPKSCCTTSCGVIGFSLLNTKDFYNYPSDHDTTILITPALTSIGAVSTDYWSALNVVSTSGCVVVPTTTGSGATFGLHFTASSVPNTNCIVYWQLTDVCGTKTGVVRTTFNANRF